MKRKATLLALLGLGCSLVFGLLYWRFLAPESSPAVQRSKTEIFAEAWGKGDFKHCYSLMTDDYRANVSESAFVAHWEGQIKPRTASFGDFHTVSQLPNRKYTFPPIDHLLGGRHPRIVPDAIYEVRFAKGDYVLNLATRDGDTDSSIDRIMLYSIPRYLGTAPAPSPTPRNDPLS